MVVARVPVPRGGGTALLKYICCEATCPGAPSNVAQIATNEFQELLYNVDTDADWAEMRPLPIGSNSSWAAAAASLRTALPPRFAAGCLHPAQPPSPSPPFTIVHNETGGCLIVAAQQLHAAAELGRARRCTEWSDEGAHGGANWKPGELVTATGTGAGGGPSFLLMLKHAAITSLCSPSKLPGTIELGPSNSSGIFGFVLTSNGTLASTKCPGLCAAVVQGQLALGSASCDDPDSQGFQRG